ncbi:MAG: HAD family phosphatase [bacterium]|nr:HAD family phosphatase [bacterium]
MIKAVIFDMDGLLIDTEPIWTLVDQRFLARYGKDYRPIDKSRFMGSGVREFIKFIKKKFAIDENEEKLLSERMEIFQSLVNEDLKLMSGAENLLQELSKNGYLVAMATGNTRQMMDLMTENLKIRKYFNVTVSSDEVPHGKPAPDIFLEAARRFDISPKECLVLEDAINGVVAAKAAGMRAIAVCDQRYNKPESFTEADMVVGSLKEITSELIRQLF